MVYDPWLLYTVLLKSVSLGVSFTVLNQPDIENLWDPVYITPC